MQATLSRPSGPGKPPVKTAIGYSDDGDCHAFFGDLYDDADLRCVLKEGHVVTYHITKKGLRWRDDS